MQYIYIYIYIGLSHLRRLTDVWPFNFSRGFGRTEGRKGGGGGTLHCSCKAAGKMAAAW